MAQARTLTDREFVQLLTRLEQGRNAQRNMLLVQMAHWAGFRVGELAELRVSDVQDTSGGIKEQVILQPHQTKGNRQRVVFIPAKLRDAIARYLMVHGKQQYLFASQKRGKFNANTLQATMTKLYADAGFDGCRSHTGRRSFITKLAAQGVGARVLQELAGHRNLATTQRYIDVNDSQKRAALLLI